MIFSSYKNKSKLLRNLLILFTIFLAVLTLLSNISPYIAILGNLTFIIVNLLVLIILFYVAKKSSKYSKRAFRGWILIALSLLATILGNIIWITLQTVFNQPSSPSIADIFYLAYYPLIIAGILYLPVTQTHDTKKYQILLDTGILIISAAMILWVILINPILKLHLQSAISMSISLSYLLLDIFLLFTLFYLLFNWFGEVKKVPLSLLTIGTAILVITNIIFVYQFLYGTYISGGLLDAGWLISYILTALAGLSYINDSKIKFIHSFPYKLSVKFNWSSYLPILWLIFVYSLLFLIYMHLEDANLNILIWGAAIIMTMVFIRQILALKESNRARKLLQNNQKILKRREEHLSLITDNMMDLITQSDANGVYQYVSPSAQKILGYDPQKMLGKNILDFVHPDDLDKVKSSIQKAVDTGSPNETEYRYKKASGGYIWIETAGNPIFGHGNDLKGFVCSSRNIDDRKHAEEQIRTSLEEKEVLLKEIHHRVKNNMQIISSLLNLQSRSVKDENSLEILKESQNRVKSMAMIHESLYRTHNLARINFEKYIQNLVSGLFSSYGINPGTIKTKLDLDDVLLDIDTAIPCGLILNELVTNSLKHAFPKGREGEMNVVLSQEDKNNMKIIVSDNGIGFPENIDFRNTESLGLQLVNTLVGQLKGEIKLEKDNGTKFSINLKK